jgi:predicted amidohydrolase
MSVVRRYQRFFSNLDVADIETGREGGEIVSFSTNLRAEIRQSWREGIRYDTGHGRLHVHRFWQEEKEQMEWI